MWIQSLAWNSGLRICVTVSYAVGHRHGLDPPLLWLWCRLAAAAQIHPLAWEPPYAASAALKTAKKKKKDGTWIHFMESAGAHTSGIIRNIFNIIFEINKHVCQG